MPGRVIDVDGAVAWVAARLRAELPSWLGYHDFEHTAGLVVPAAELLGADLALDPESLDLLRTAAWFHDVGYIERYRDNEAVGVALAEEVLPGFGYSAAQVSVVADAIWATQLPQRPGSTLAAALCDADLFVLGTDRIFEREALLRAELEHTGEVHSDEEWNRGQVEFVGAHRYLTDAARRRNDATKARNLEILRARLT